MTVIIKPTLPDPGQGRYWSVSLDETGFIIVTLLDSTGVRMLADKIAFEAATLESIELLAASVLAKFTKASQFTGLYKF